MAEVIWEEKVLSLRKYLLFYGSLKFGELSANKLNGKFKDTVAYLNSTRAWANVLKSKGWSSTRYGAYWHTNVTDFTMLLRTVLMVKP